MPKDDKIINDYIKKLQEFQDKANQDVRQAALFSMNLSKIKNRVVSYNVDESTGGKTPVFDKPLDSDLGNVPMNDDKIQSIFDANIKLADKLLSDLK